MTTVVILLLGAGLVLITSAVESTASGSDVSILQTISDIWQDKVNFQQGNTPAPGTGSGPAPSQGGTAYGQAMQMYGS